MPDRDAAPRVHYLEIVTPEVDAVVRVHTAALGVEFVAPDPALGNARTATLADGTLLGIRAPMHADEEPVTRPYVLVEDLEAAVEAVAAAGGQIVVPAMEIPGHGRCAIYFLGGVQHGLWER